MPHATSRHEPPRSPWQALPWLLRVSALYSLCLVALAAGLYLVVRVLLAVSALSLAVATALLLTALMHPVTALLRRLRLPGAVAALGGVLTMLAFLALAGVFVTGRVANEIGEFDETLGSGLREIRAAILAGPLPVTGERLDSIVDTAQGWVTDAPADPGAAASGTVTVLGAALLAVVLVFFLLKDGDRMWGWVLRLVPQRLRPAVDEAGRTGWWTLSRYIGGQVVVAAVDAVGIGLALLLIGVPLVAPLMLLTFLAGFVPIVGATVAGAAAVLVALVSNGPTDALLVLAAVIAVQQLEGNLLEPLIVGRALRLHPVPVLLAVTAGTLTSGIAGAVIAVPLMAVLYRSGGVLLRRRAAGRGSAPVPAVTGTGAVAPGLPARHPRLRRARRPSRSRRVRWAVRPRQIR